MKEVLNNSQFISVAITILISILALFSYLLLYVRNKTKEANKYNHVMREVELDYMRTNLESKITDLTKKLEDSQSKWIEINHLVLSGQNRARGNQNISSNDFTRSFGIDTNSSIDDKLVFVLTPFHSNYKASFYTIRKICTKFGFKCIRGDEDYVSNDILSNILQNIVNSRFIIANISGRNPNVMYELGIAQALGKQVIIAAENNTDLPFDLSSKRVIFYNSISELESNLEKAILSLLINQPA